MRNFWFRKAIKKNVMMMIPKERWCGEREAARQHSIKLKCDIRAVDFIYFFLSFVTVKFSQLITIH